MSKSDLVNPLFEHGHWEAQAVALGDCLHFMAEQRPTVIDRATGGSQSVLRPVSQGMDDLALIDNANAAEELVEPFRRRWRAALKQWPLYHLGQMRQHCHFAGLAGAGMALLTPDLWSPWPSYPAIYFFLAHGGVVTDVSMLVFGRVAPLRRGAPWRALTLLLAYAAAVGGIDALLGSNYMYLCRKPKSASLLDALGPWPVYLAAGAAAALALFWLLWLPARAAARNEPPAG